MSAVDARALAYVLAGLVVFAFAMDLARMRDELRRIREALERAFPRPDTPAPALDRLAASEAGFHTPKAKR